MKRLGVLLTALAIGLVGSEAWALSCMRPRSEVVSPVDGSIDVPTNSLILLGDAHTEEAWSSRRALRAQAQAAGSEDAARLNAQADVLPDGPQQVRVLDASGREVPLRARGRIRTGGDIGSLGVWETTEPLVPNAQYELWAGLARLSRFRVGTLAKTEPPKVQVRALGGFAEKRHLVRRVPWRPAVGFEFDVTHDGAVVLVDLDGTGRFDATTLSGEVADLTVDRRVFLGRKICSQNWPGVDTGSKAQVRFGVLDAAGNFSGWSAPVEAQTPSFHGLGCTAVTAVPWPLLALMLLGAVRSKRRRAA
jgi:hypothetical protein